MYRPRGLPEYRLLPDGGGGGGGCLLGLVDARGGGGTGAE